jgi:hypothetical protein
MTITVYGASDDLIEVEGDITEEFNHYETAEDGEGCLLAFSDGTVLRIRYTKAGIWRITPVTNGTAGLAIDVAPEDDEDKYTDRATLTGEVRWVVLGVGCAQAPGGSAGGTLARETGEVLG